MKLILVIWSAFFLKKNNKCLQVKDFKYLCFEISKENEKEI